MAGVKRWTPFVRIAIPANSIYLGDTKPTSLWRNSRYQVARWHGETPGWGEWCRLSIRDHKHSTRHDWRDFQRIKNELCGPEFEAIEIYPAESRLVDAANQYHLFVFRTLRFPMGFPQRLVVVPGRSRFARRSMQRPFEQAPGEHLTAAEFDARVRLAGSGPRLRHG